MNHFCPVERDLALYLDMIDEEERAEQLAEARRKEAIDEHVEALKSNPEQLIDAVSSYLATKDGNADPCDLLADLIVSLITPSEFGNRRWLYRTDMTPEDFARNLADCAARADAELNAGLD